MVYNPWPIGNLPEGFARPELDILRSQGLKFGDPRDIVKIFEKRIAEYSGSKYAAVVDCASNAIFLCLKYLNMPHKVVIPRRTYVSVPMQIIHAGYSFELRDVSWSGIYQLGHTGIYDGAARFSPNMFIGGKNTMQVLSFQIKKRLPIGRGGAILTDNYDVYEWIKLASYDGRDLETPYTDISHVKFRGWHMYMTPEDAARGLILLDRLGEKEFPDIASDDSYPDLQHWLESIQK
jgi:dTDP-4-amino-4,6-dideoxygalactose transaminase